jgi:hypothetical protein
MGCVVTFSLGGKGEDKFSGFEIFQAVPPVVPVVEIYLKEGKALGSEKVKRF